MLILPSRAEREGRVTIKSSSRSDVHTIHDQADRNSNLHPNNSITKSPPPPHLPHLFVFNTSRDI